MHTEAPTTSHPSTPISTCPKCGTARKSGKRSCCARGGAWFKNCGDVRDSKFNHTWSDGVQACRGFGNEESVASSVQVMFRQTGVIVLPPNTTTGQNHYHYAENTSSVRTVCPMLLLLAMLTLVFVFF